MKMRKIATGLAVVLAIAGGACAAVTNAVPWTESFESYTNGMLVVGTNGWSAQVSDAGMVTNMLSVTNYPVGGKSFPVAGTVLNHSNALAISAQLQNNIASVTGGMVKIDFLALPAWSDTPPAGDTNKHYQFCITTNNGHLTVWHYNQSAGSNEWWELAGSPVIGTSSWCRFTVVQDYSNNLYSVAVNEGNPIPDARGWSQGGLSANGPWFRMVKTNKVMGAVVVDAAPAYIDDLVVARRALTYSRAALAENVTNDGSVDNSTPLTIGLSSDTFTGSAGDNLVGSGKASVSGLPSNLVATILLSSTTQAVLSVSGQALQHELANSTNLAVQFADSAFTLGAAWDVLSSQTNLSLTFSNTPSLSYSVLAYSESTANDGTIDNSSPCTITLVNGSFSGSSGEDFATNSKVAFLNMPQGLTGRVSYVSNTQVQFTLLGAAVSNNVANNLGNLTLSFQSAAFAVVPATSVFHASTNFSVSFTDPSTLSYGVTVFPESVVNNGTVSGTTLTLANKSFTGNSGDDLVAQGKVTVTHLPAGLGVQVLRGATAQGATIVFTGAATSHAAANSINNLGLQFLDTAFVGGNAAGVSNYNLSNLQIAFLDPRTLAYSGTTFTELCAGLIDNRHPVVITLSGDTFTGAISNDFNGSKVVVTGLPSGLTAQILRISATQLSVTLQGSATANAPANSTSAVTFTLQDSAVTSGGAQYVGNYAQGITVTFINDNGYFNVLPYQESFEHYAAGTQLVGSNGWTGDSVTAAVVSNDAAINSAVQGYQGGLLTLPISGTHTQVLAMQDNVRDEVHSEAATNVYVDFMMRPVAMVEPPTGDTNHQCAFYITTNGALAIWQSTHGGGAPVNEWIVLSNAPTISTTTWYRFTVEHDYLHGMYQLWVNQGSPITDPRGWTGSGGAQNGSWFYMVQTNGSLSSVHFTGYGSGFIDDLEVTSDIPDTFVPPSGSIYLIR